MKVIQAHTNHLLLLAPLFQQYRSFYKHNDALADCEEFLSERMTNCDSIILLAVNDDETEGLGFTQLYPCFSSIAMKKIWILNDLFVSEAARRQGCAQTLLKHAIEFSEASEAYRLELKTEVNNLGAQKLYNSFGFYEQDAYKHYWWNHIN